jgi:hypothetical protein
VVAIIGEGWGRVKAKWGARPENELNSQQGYISFGITSV